MIWQPTTARAYTSGSRRSFRWTSGAIPWLAGRVAEFLGPDKHDRPLHHTTCTWGSYTARECKRYVYIYMRVWHIRYMCECVCVCGWLSLCAYIYIYLYIFIIYRYIKRVSPEQMEKYHPSKANLDYRFWLYWSIYHTCWYWQ
jgi:hypothetical protein